MERALQRISRDDVIIKCIHEMKAVTDENEKDVARKELGIEKEKGEQSSSQSDNMNPVMSRNDI